MENAAITTVLLSWSTGGFKVTKSVTPFTLTRIGDERANNVTDVVEVYMSQQSFFETQSHITPHLFFRVEEAVNWRDAVVN